MVKRGFWNQGGEEGQSSKGTEGPIRKRVLPRVDQEILNGEHPNDFDRWLAGQRSGVRGRRADVGEYVGV